MPLYDFPIAAFFVALLLVVVYFSKKRVKNSETKIYQFMLIASLIDSFLSLIVVTLFYTLPNTGEGDIVITVINRFELLQYLFWVGLLTVYIFGISFKERKFYKRIKNFLIKLSIIVSSICGLLILSLPLYFHREESGGFTYGPAVDLLYIFCASCLVLIVLSTFTNIKNVSKKYTPIFALIILFIVAMIVREIYPNLIILPPIIAFVNLIMFFTIENPDIKMLKVAISTKEKMEQLGRAKDEFMSIASHQMRTPITAIEGYSEMLIKGDFGKLTDKQKKAIKLINKSATSMSNSIKDFLDVSRIQTGRFVLEKTRVDIKDIVKKRVSQIENLAEEKEIKVITNYGDNLPEKVLVDADKISQVILNFIDNAIYYTQSKHHVIISLKVKNNKLIFTVDDQGIGVPTKDRRKIFEKFFRSSNARIVRPDGTGIGLFLAKKIILAHGGLIIFNSIENEGSIFGFSLPLDKIK